MKTIEQAQNEFLRSLGIYGEEQDAVDLEYLQEVHWEEWEEISSRCK